MDDVIFALTFDDGPNTSDLANRANLTLRVVETLANNPTQRGIKAAFFVQTHFPGTLPHPNGEHAAVYAHGAGHVVTVHTGSLENHTPHVDRVKQPPDPAVGGENGLDTDMIRARARLAQLTGEPPKYVRATQGIWNEACREVYERNCLKVIYWDMSNYDRRSPPAGHEEANQKLREQVKELVCKGKRRLVVLCHDTSEETATHLGSYIRTLADATAETGHRARFTSSRGELEALLDARPERNSLHIKMRFFVPDEAQYRERLATMRQIGSQFPGYTESWIEED